MSAEKNKGARARAATRIEKPEDRPLDWPGDPESLTAEAVDFEAIAHVLANTCRRGGRLRRFHSLAAHGLLMSEAIEALGGPGSGDLRAVALHALLAEASVAWLGVDATRRGTERLKRLGGKIGQAVLEAAGLDPEPSPEHAELLRFVARMAEAAEDRDLPGARESAGVAVVFPPLDRRIRTLDPDRAAKLWLERLHDLKKTQAAKGSTTESKAEDPGEENHPTQQEKRDVTHARTTTASEQSPLTGGSRDAA